MPKFSVVLPVRNGGDYVKKCVSSILTQTMPDLNLHVLDNCSTDGTLEWIRSIDDDRIIIVPTDRPLTIEENWARITSVPKNKFVTLIGHDDLLEENYLAVMSDLIDKYPTASLYQTHFKYIDAKGGTIRRCKPMPQTLTAPDFLSFFLCNIIDSMGTGFMMRSGDYDKLGGIPMYPNLLFADFELWINLTRSSYMATAFDECFSFRLHQSTTTTSSNAKFQSAFNRFVQFLKTLKTDDQLNAVIQRHGLAFMSFYAKGLSHRLLRTPAVKREGKTVKSLVNECRDLANELVSNTTFDPSKIFSVRLAMQIDSNPVFRNMFLGFKKLYSKPIYS